MKLKLLRKITEISKDTEIEFVEVYLEPGFPANDILKSTLYYRYVYKDGKIIWKYARVTPSDDNQIEIKPNEIGLLRELEEARANAKKDSI